MPPNFHLSWLMGTLFFGNSFLRLQYFQNLALTFIHFFVWFFIITPPIYIYIDRKTCQIYNFEKINVIYISVPMLMNNLKKNYSKCSDLRTVRIKAKHNNTHRFKTKIKLKNSLSIFWFFSPQLVFTIKVRLGR